jgi:hypothetical protein
MSFVNSLHCKSLPQVLAEGSTWMRDGTLLAVRTELQHDAPMLFTCLIVSHLFSSLEFFSILSTSSPFLVGGVALATLSGSVPELSLGQRSRRCRAWNIGSKTQAPCVNDEAKKVRVIPLNIFEQCSRAD